jgi:hypothetical protein
MVINTPPPFATTVDYLSDPRFAARTRLVRRPPPGNLQDAAVIFGRILRAARHEDVLLLTSSWGRLHPDILAAAAIGMWPARLRPIVVLMGCMWEPNNGIRLPLEKFILKLADRAINRYVVQSTEELSVFPETWGVDPAKVRFCPFFFSFTPEDLQAADNGPEGDYVFAGGNSHRDYEPLLAAARCMPERRFVFATHLLDHHEHLPPNVQVGLVSHRQFVTLMRSAAATIVPIRRGLRRAVGQQTYLNAMWLRRPTIVTDTLGVRDHVRHRETALIVEGSPESYLEALRWIFDPQNQAAVQRLRHNARRVVQEQFSFEKHIARLLNIMDETIGDSVHSGD